MESNWSSRNPSEYDGKLLEENSTLKAHLRWCLELLENFPMEPCHEGLCSPPATPCDGPCVDSHYFWKTINEIKKLVN